jgi:putative NADH-flavin reductase
MTHSSSLRSVAARVAALLALTSLPALTAVASTIVIYGASGNLGGKIVTEALNRGHDVIGVSRNPDSLDVDHSNFSAVGGDVSNLESMLEIIRGVDVVIVSVGGNGIDYTPENSAANQAALTFIQAARQLGAASPRVIQMGGGTTLLDNGVFGLDRLDVEEGTARHGLYYGHWEALLNYRAATDVRWTVVSPPPGAALHPGERTGVFRLGEDEVIVGENGEASISEEDLAMAYINEVEDPQSIGKRITIGY